MIIDTMHNIYDFLLTDPLYQGLDQNQLQENIAFCVLSKQYLWEPGRYAVLYWMIDPADRENVFRKIYPKTFINGSLLYIAECLCRDGMTEIRRKLRERCKQGVCWKTKGKPFYFARQKGGQL